LGFQLSNTSSIQNPVNFQRNLYGPRLSVGYLADASFGLIKVESYTQRLASRSESFALAAIFSEGPSQQFEKSHCRQFRTYSQAQWRENSVVAKER
jgi:hypothetical protein